MHTLDAYETNNLYHNTLPIAIVCSLFLPLSLHFFPYRWPFLVSLSLSLQLLIWCKFRVCVCVCVRARTCVYMTFMLVCFSGIRRNDMRSMFRRTRDRSRNRTSAPAGNRLLGIFTGQQHALFQYVYKQTRCTEFLWEFCGSCWFIYILQDDARCIQYQTHYFRSESGVFTHTHNKRDNDDVFVGMNVWFVIRVLIQSSGLFIDRYKRVVINIMLLFSGNNTEVAGLSSILEATRVYTSTIRLAVVWL